MATKTGWGLGPVLEATLLMVGSGAGPCLGGAGRGPGSGSASPQPVGLEYTIVAVTCSFS